MGAERINGIKYHLDQMSDDELGTLEYNLRGRLNDLRTDLERVIRWRNRDLGQLAIDACLYAHEGLEEL